MNEEKGMESIFQALGDANRLNIIKLIGQGQRSVSEIVQNTRLSQPLVSHHLRILRENRLLEAKREGPFIYYRQKDIRLLAAIETLAKILRENKLL